MRLVLMVLVAQAIMSLCLESTVCRLVVLQYSRDLLYSNGETHPV